MKDVMMAIALISIVISLKAIHMSKEEKPMDKRAWIVEPELVDRFLDVLAYNGFKWLSIPGANELKSWDYGDVVLFIETLPKKITYQRRSPHTVKQHKGLNIIVVTEEWLGDKENKIIAKKAQL